MLDAQGDHEAGEDLSYGYPGQASCVRGQTSESLPHRLLLPRPRLARSGPVWRGSKNPRRAFGCALRGGRYLPHDLPHESIGFARRPGRWLALLVPRPVIPDRVGDAPCVSRLWELVAAQTVPHRPIRALLLFGHRPPARTAHRTPGPFCCARLVPIPSFWGVWSN